MKFEITHLSSVKKELRIELPAERVTRSFNRFSNEIARKVQLPGFRPGKAPLALVRRYYQRDIYERVLRHLSLEAINEAITAAQLQVVGEPVVRDLRLDDQSPFVLRLEVDVFPEFTVGPLEGLEGVKTITPVTDADVDRMLDNLRAATAKLEEVTDGSPAQPNDLVLVALEGFVLEDGATAPDEGRPPTIPRRLESVEIGGENTRREFDEAVRGKVVGDRVEVEIQYPAEGAPKVALPRLPVVDLSGKRVRFRLTVEKILRRVLPPLDDAWAQEKAGLDLASLRRRVRADLEASLEKRATESLDNQLVDQLIARTGVEAPESLVEEQLSARLRDWVRHLESQGNSLPADSELQKLKEALRPRVETDVKRVLILEQVAREAGVKVTEEDLSRAIADIAARANLSPETVRARLTREDNLNTLRLQLRTQKALDLIRNAARVEIKTAAPSDMPTPEKLVSFPPKNQ